MIKESYKFSSRILELGGKTWQVYPQNFYEKSHSYSGANYAAHDQQDSYFLLLCCKLSSPR